MQSLPQHCVTNRIEAILGHFLLQTHQMICIYCLSEEASFTTVEHIVPASLGNEEHVLRDLVCDACNNYLSREVEKPFLESTPVRNARFLYGLESRRGRIPPASGFVAPGLEIGLLRMPSGDRKPKDRGRAKIATDREESDQTPVERSSGIDRRLPVDGNGIGTLWMITDLCSVAPDLRSRFLGKVALGAFAMSWGDQATAVDFDGLRDHVRRGRPRSWITDARNVYIPGELGNERSPDGEPYTTLHEFNFLTTDDSELYFTLIVLGAEFTMNLRRSEIDGYRKWLDVHNGISPLYV